MKKILILVFVLMISFINAMAQSGQTFSGTVLDDHDEPLMGVSVHVKGTSTATMTDANGRFSIKCSPGATLTFDYIGFLSQEHDVQGKTSIEVRMSESPHDLNEVIVVAYGTAKKSSYSGSASMVGQNALKDIPITTFENALNGRVAGLQVSNSSGQAGSTPSIRIRGIGSMNASNEPLYVIDGVPVTSGDVGQMSDYIYSTNNVMNSLSPNDIESISVLKDAAASSLYGSRAANGVILITTKKGSQGKTHVDLNISVGFTPSWATKNYEPAKTEQQVEMLYKVFHDYKTSGGSSDEAANSYSLGQLNRRFNKHGYAFSTDGVGLNAPIIISDYNNSGRAGKYFDWDKAYFRTATFQNYDFAVSGATPNVNYYTSFAYTRDEGRIRINNFDRFSGRINLTAKAGKFLELSSNVSASRTTTEGYNDTRNTGSNLFMQTRNLLWGLYWPTDFATGEDWTSRYGSYAYNALYYNKQWENRAQNNKFNVTEALTLHLLPVLDVKSIFSYDNTTVKDHIYFSADHFSASSDNGRVHEMRTVYEKMVSSTTANYNQSFGDHNVQLMAGFEAEKNKTDFTRSTGTNLPTSTLHTVSTAGSTEASGYNWGNSLVSFLSKAGYQYAGKYFASASFRRDGSSKLSRNSRWGNFWSLAGSWNIKRESFMESLENVSALRLRMSYGVNGTLPTNNYGYMNLITYNTKYMGDPGGTLSTLADNDLSWETNYTYNVGIDFGFWNNRLRGSIEYFNRTSKNLLQDMPITRVTGFSSTLRNIGRINNHGLETEVSYDIISNHGWLWTASVNATFLTSKVKRLYNGADIIWYDPTGDDDRAQYIYREGESTLAFYGYEWAGVDPSNGASVYYVNAPEDDQKGDFIYNGRGATYDYKKANSTIIGNAIPNVTGGLNTTLSYKGIELAANFIYKIGGSLYDGAYKDVADDGYYWERIRSKNYYDNMWTAENHDGSEPMIRGIDLEDAMQYSSRHIFNASFLRLKNVSLGYNLPKALVSKAYMQGVRIYFNATNLLTFSKYKDADPEVNQYGTRGWETPLGKTFTLGVNLKF